MSTLLMNMLVVMLVVIAVLLFFFLSVAKANRKSEKASEKDKKEAAEVAFKRFDTDGRGINKDEMTAMCAKIDERITKKQVTELFEAADRDGGGIIDFTEFYTAIKNHGDGQENEQIDMSALVSRSQRNALAADATGRVSLLAFLLYPSLTTKSEQPPCVWLFPMPCILPGFFALSLRRVLVP